MTITFSEASNIIVVTGYSEVTPCNFTDLHNADKAGILSLHARTGIVATDGVGVAVDRAERPTDFIVLGGASNDLYITIANWDGTTATIRITGTDYFGVTQTENVIVNADGTYQTAKQFKTIIHTQVISFIATSFDYDLIQGQWGKVWKQGTKQFQLDSTLVVGNWSTPTWVQDTNKQIVFSELCFVGSYIIYVTNNANFTLGKLENEAKKITSSGCDLRLDVAEYIAGITNSGNTNFYSTNVYGGKSTGGNGTHYMGVTRMWNSHTSEGAIIYKGSPDISLMISFSNSFGIYGGGGVISELIVKDCYIGIRYAEDCTVSNGTFVNCTYITSPWVNDCEVNLIDCISDSWNLHWSNKTGNTVYRKYTFNLKVLDADKNNIENATIILKDKDGTELFSLTTNTSGEIVEQTVTYGYYQQPTGNTIQNASPHILKVKKAGYKTYRAKFEMDNVVDWTITLNRSILNIDSEVLS